MFSFVVNNVLFPSRNKWYLILWFSTKCNLSAGFNLCFASSSLMGSKFEKSVTFVIPVFINVSGRSTKRMLKHHTIREVVWSQTQFQTAYDQRTMSLLLKSRKRSINESPRHHWCFSIPFYSLSLSTTLLLQL